ncbi:hypothetical protein NLG97_g3301 [Lecanicillium saksenae]|uniref:Uncharacterized protein n=1 Tax=Lecanicillium saksenae TaxID=468837 RepID=A0ACC1QZQ5_9HYPO|nr:hypothetical protein NLG97_g3301 [Lecanicillium saksenae]
MQAYRQIRDSYRLGWLGNKSAHAFTGLFRAKVDRSRGRITKFSQKGLEKAVRPRVSGGGCNDMHPLPLFQKPRFENSRFLGFGGSGRGRGGLYPGRSCADDRLLYRQRKNTRRSQSRQFEKSSSACQTSDPDHGDPDVTMTDADAVPVSPSQTQTFDWIGYQTVTQPDAFVRHMRPIEGLPVHLYSGHLVNPDKQDEVDLYDHLVASTSEEKEWTRELCVPRLLTDSDTLQPIDFDKMDLDSPYQIADPVSSWKGIPESRLGELLDSLWEEFPDSDSEEILVSTWEECPDSGWEECPDSSWEEIPDGSWEESPGSSWEGEDAGDIW